jgi:hypothetical protein
MPPSDAMLQYRLYRTTEQGAAIAFMETSASDLEGVNLEIGTLLNKMLITFRRMYSDLQFELENWKSSCRGINGFSIQSTCPSGRKLITVRDAALYITKLPKAEHDAEEWQAAMEALLLVAEHDGLTMSAWIGVMRALNADNGASTLPWMPR